MQVSLFCRRALIGGLPPSGKHWTYIVYSGVFMKCKQFKRILYLLTLIVIQCKNPVFEKHRKSLKGEMILCDAAVLCQISYKIKAKAL